VVDVCWEILLWSIRGRSLPCVPSIRSAVGFGSVLPVCSVRGRRGFRRPRLCIGSCRSPSQQTHEDERTNGHHDAGESAPRDAKKRLCRGARVRDDIGVRGISFYPLTGWPTSTPGRPGASRAAAGDAPRLAAGSGAGRGCESRGDRRHRSAGAARLRTACPAATAAGAIHQRGAQDRLAALAGTTVAAEDRIGTGSCRRRAAEDDRSRNRCETAPTLNYSCLHAPAFPISGLSNRARSCRAWPWRLPTPPLAGFGRETSLRAKRPRPQEASEGQRRCRVRVALPLTAVAVRRAGSSCSTLGHRGAGR
jgi:hypothetical protein